jgi:quinolinate synthase
VRAAHPGADFLIHPECGCSTSVMEYVASGDVSPEGVHMLSTGGMLDYARATESRAGDDRREHGTPDAGARGRAREAVVATEVGMLYPLRMAAPDVEFIPANPEASCVFMKMITLPKLRDSLRELRYEVRVPAEIAARARVPIDRMVAIG